MSTTAYDTITATSYIRAFAYKERLTLNVTQCQKILYIIYGYCLAKYDRVVFLESPKAWPFGPVFPISQKKGDYVNVDDLEDPKFNAMNTDKDFRNAVEKIVKKYGGIPATKLSSWSHAKGGPWDKCLEDNDWKYNVVIPNELIKEYFERLDV